jgi:hypothetical protein
MEKNNSFKLIQAFVFIAASLLCERAFASNIYVDPTLSQDITNGKYSIQTRNNSGTDGNAYRKVQTAITAMKPGDAVFMRGGIYQEGAIDIPVATSGDSLHWSSLQSYPGEWAVLDGQNKLTYPNYFVLGHNCMSTYECELHYWRFERFEIKNGKTVTDSFAVGLWTAGGPFVFRRLYIHDAGCSSSSENPSGLRVYRMQNSIVEYCYFKNNGECSTHNCSHIAIFSDYKWQYDSLVDINHAIRKNEYRYNLFDGAYCGWKDKGTQLMVKNHSGKDMRYKDYGDKLHHNIFLNSTETVDGNQDFLQIYNNIIIGGALMASEEASSESDRIWLTVYNNTITNGVIALSVDYANPPSNFHPYFGAVNNIVDSAATTWELGAISVGLCRSTAKQTVDMSDCQVNRNFIYQPLNQNHFVVGYTGNSCMGFLTTQKMDTCYKVNNFSNSLAGLFKGTTGSARYKTNGSFSPASGFTISSGGIGGNHPYLDGVRLPTYIGAVDPDDDGWVDGVLDLVHLADSNENTRPMVTNVRLWRGTVTYCDSTDTIFWKADDDKGVVTCSLWVTVDNGSSWQFLTKTDGSVNKFSWQIPKTPNKRCQIWVRAYDADGKYGDGKSPVFQISDKKKSILLKVIPLDETSAKVYWYASVPDSTSGTMVGIFYKTGGYVNSAGQSGSDSLICPVEVAQDTALNLSKRATYYFSAFFRDPGGTWESGGDSSQASLVMPDLTPPVNNFSLKAAGLDSTKVVVTWHSVSQGSADADSIGICFRTDFFPSVMRDSGASVATANDLKDSNDTIVGLKSNSVYYFSLFVRDTSGNWSAATESSKARAVLSSWGNKVTFPSADTLRFYNDTLALWSTKDVSAMVDTIDRLLSLPVLTGFIQLSPCFYFRNGALLQTGSVGIKVRFYNYTIANNLSFKNARIYKFDLNSGKIVSENSPLQVVDTANHSVTLITSDLRFPFMVLLDTLRPTIRWLNRSRQINPPNAGELLQDTVLITDNISNLTRSFYCGPGNAALLSYPDSMKATSGDTLFKTSIPQNIVQECSGYHAFVVVSDGIYKEVLDVSRPVRLADSHCDGFNAPGMEWSPICLTAQPDNHAAQALLASMFPQPGQWKYDKTVCRMIRWYPCEQNNSNPIKWVEFGDVDDSVFSLYPGIVTWIKPRNGVQIDFGPATMASLRNTAAIPLNQQEWTDFGLPFQFPVLVDSIIAATRNGNPAYPIDSLQLYRWKKTGKMYTTVPIYLSGIPGVNGDRDSLVGGPGNGYAAFNPLPISLELYVPPQCPAISGQLGVMGLGKKSSAVGGYWSIRIDGSLSNGTVLTPLYCGYAMSKSNKRPTYYRVPPSFSSVGIRVYDHLGEREYGHEVIHEFPQDGVFFDLLFCNSSDSAQEISCNAATGIGLPDNLSHAIFDPYGKADIKAQNQSQVSVPANSKRHRFLAVGTKEYLDRLERALLNQKTMLNTIYPNPFRKTIKVSFTLPFVDVREVRFQLFSCSGRIISSKTITTGLLPGLNSFVWNGPNGSSSAIAAGTYIVRMSVAHFETNKTEIFKKRLTCLP